MYFDTHCHLTLFKDIPSVISKARAHSVNYILAVSMYYRDNWSVLKLAEEYPEIIPALGIHPIEAPNLSNLEKKFESLDKLILENNIHVIGEIGLDRYFNKTVEAWKQQLLVFEHYLELAERNNCIINLHGKDAEGELFAILTKYNLRTVVVHWFAGSPKLIKDGINRGFYFSVTPAVTYSKKMRSVVELVPMEQLLSESDGPVKYKKPHRFIGEPALMEEVVKEIADIKQKNHEEVARFLYKTAKGIFLKKL
ncbi:MAG: TatD family hydrolase [Candidatus Helarchaeota archaeon]|nr:TatD family hydrolase [Candidatus Helarchaeota archaeon]